MVHFKENKLVIEIDARFDRPSELYYGLIDALTEVTWYALLNDEENIIREETGFLVRHLLTALHGADRPASERPDPAND